MGGSHRRRSAMPTRSSALTLEELDTASWDEKVFAFAGLSPWRQNRIRIRMPNKVTIDQNDMRTDGRGNVLDMPSLVGRPCFGIITAVLRHGSTSDRWVARAKKMMPSRCGACKARLGCHRLASERILSSTELLRAFENWKNKGGRSMFASDKAYHAVKGSWTRLTQLVRTSPFSSVNDAVVAKYYTERRQEFLRKDRDRKKKERARARAAGIIDQELFDDIAIERDRRITRLGAAMHGPGAPRWMSKLHDHSCGLIANAWMGNVLLSLGGKKTNPSRIAQWMIDHGGNSGLGRDVLRQRVPDDLARARKLEKLVLPGASDPVWQPFTPPIN
jgi:hypothetical protein